jgi:hypothetical protein
MLSGGRLFVAKIEEFAYVPERLQQSFTNFAVALRLARGGPIAQLPVLSSGGVPYVLMCHQCARLRDDP